MAKTLDQRRAAHAWAAVERAKTCARPKKYGGQAKKLPVRILGAGLGQAAAFLNAKGYAPDLLRDLGDWLLDKHPHPDSVGERPAAEALQRAIMDGSADQLRRLTDEALAWLQWLNRFAEAAGITDLDDDG